MMLSGFICPCHRRMETSADQVPAFEAFVADKHPETVFTGKSKFDDDDHGKGCSSFTHMTPGKNEDGWRTGLDVVAQTKEVMPIFEFLHRDKVALFVFDNSTNHSVHPVDALGVFQGVNKGPGGVKAPGSEILPEAGAASDAVKVHRPKMQDGWCLRGGVRVAQQMHEADNAGDPAKFEPVVVPGVFRGVEAILKERGCFAAEGAKVPKGKCDLKDGAARPDLQHCCRHLLAAQPDFVAQSTALEKLISDAGHMHMHKMLPKCHPELNPIEQFGAALKECLRRVCGMAWHGMAW